MKLPKKKKTSVEHEGNENNQPIFTELKKKSCPNMSHKTVYSFTYIVFIKHKKSSCLFYIEKTTQKG